MKLAVLAFCLSILVACVSGPSAEMIQAKRDLDALTARAEAGQISWIAWGRETDAIWRTRVSPNPSPQLAAYLTYRLVVAEEMEAKRMTPTHGRALLAQKYSELSEAESRVGALERSNRPQPRAAVTCTRIGNSVTCV